MIFGFRLEPMIGRARMALVVFVGSAGGILLN
jgi:hypothetical protein